jgi:hypothetical protein
MADILGAMRLRAVAGRLLLLSIVLATGCQRTLFAQNEGPRTQFETYDLMRQRYVPMEEPDVFGNPRPALRARLSRTR